MRKSVLIGFSLLIIGLTVGALYFASGGDLPTTLPALRREEKIDSVGVTSDLKLTGFAQAKSIALTRADVTSRPGDVLYTLRGKFSEKPDFDGDILKGKFVFTGDSSATPIGIHFTLRSGSFTYGEPRGDKVAFGAIKVTDLQQKLEADKEYEIGFTKGAGSNLAGIEAMAAELDTIIQGGKIRENPQVIIVIHTIRPL